MNQIILASHGNLAKGLYDTLSMIIGNVDYVYAFSSYRDEDEEIKVVVERVVKKNYEKDNIYILTDILGGSVNTELMTLLKDYPNVKIIAGMNLPLVISIVTCDDISEELLEMFIKDSQQSIVYCNHLIEENLFVKEGEL